MKIPHRNDVTRALTNVRAVTRRTLRDLNGMGGQRRAKGDYATAELLASKGRELKQFVQEVEHLLLKWRGLTGGRMAVGSAKKEATPLWGYYQPILRAIIAAGGQCLRQDIEAVIEASPDEFLKPPDRETMSGNRERWKVMIRRARKPMRMEGWIYPNSGAKWKITEAGRKAAEHPGTNRKN
jgi:hypothetical protein